ncbi:MAG: TerD family protein [Spirulinaceae cyanobacterium]
MAIHLQKGQRIALDQAASGLERLWCSLGWDVAERPEGVRGFFVEQHDCDLDVTVVCLNASQCLGQDEDVIYFGNLRHPSGAITHMGDHLTGGGQGDNEQIVVELGKVPATIQTLVFIVNIYRCYDRHQDFSDIHNAFIRLVDRATEQEIARYHLSGSHHKGMTALKMIALQRLAQGWEVMALGEGMQVAGLKEIIDSYR